MARTLAHIKRTFWWPFMCKKVNDFVRACPQCATGKSSSSSPSGLLHPLPIPIRPWSHIAMGFVTGLPPSLGHTVILTVVDRFSKAAHFIPLPKLPPAKETADLLVLHLVRLYGIPLDIVSDPGPQFMSQIDIKEADGDNLTLTVIIFSGLDNVLPARDQENSSTTVIGSQVVLIQSSGNNITDVSLTFDILNKTLGNPKCVFWNFTLFDGLGGWDEKGCTVQERTNETVTCTCNHLTSFSILMSPIAPPAFLDWITYIGLIISIISLIICLIVEAIVWKKIRGNSTSYLRHVSIVNIAVSLLIADIWFLIGAGISAADRNKSACTAVTFFIHFFYLAMFFWMLASALLLLYRMLNVFGNTLSKTSLLAIGFSLGYGAPLVIVSLTIAVTAPKDTYIHSNGVCFLNWDESKALLAFVIPALLIVLINLTILIVVLFRIVGRRVRPNSSQAGEDHVLLVIAKTLAVLTPLFGLTWGLGIGTMADPQNLGAHVTFSLFNSLQGFFVLVVGTLLDKKVRSVITIKSQTSRSGTRSTSAGHSSSFLDFFRRGPRGGLQQ
ncbi:adhesion G-protein coupled receptor F1-like [Pholidichthys leucotaenia]